LRRWGLVIERRRRRRRLDVTSNCADEDLSKLIKMKATRREPEFPYTCSAAFWCHAREEVTPGQWININSHMQDHIIKWIKTINFFLKKKLSLKTQAKCHYRRLMQCLTWRQFYVHLIFGVILIHGVKDYLYFFSHL
jgi:hypothetical protein